MPDAGLSRGGSSIFRRGADRGSRRPTSCSRGSWRCSPARISLVRIDDGAERRGSSAHGRGMTLRGSVDSSVSVTACAARWPRRPAGLARRSSMCAPWARATARAFSKHSSDSRIAPGRGRVLERAPRRINSPLTRQSSASKRRAAVSRQWVNPVSVAASPSSTRSSRRHASASKENHSEAARRILARRSTSRPSRISARPRSPSPCSTSARPRTDERGPGPEREAVFVREIGRPRGDPRGLPPLAVEHV